MCNSICEHLLFDENDTFTAEQWEKVNRWLHEWFKDEVGCRLERFGGMSFAAGVAYKIQQALGMEADDEEDD